MPTDQKIFTYETEGLSYTVLVYQDPDTGEFLADITMLEGEMDVNALYFGDDDFSGSSENLGGPLNMNGASLDGEKVQWDDAVELSDPGLGPDGAEKDTFLTEGETYTVSLDIDSLDDVDVLGIRATSTSTDEGSIKGVSDDPTEPEEPQDPTFDKVGFGIEVGDNGVISNGVYVSEENLPEGEDGTFENYVNFYDSQFDVTEVETVIFYELIEETDINGDPLEIPQELFRIDAPDSGFQDADELLAAYDEAIEGGALDGAGSDGDESLELMAALSLADDEDGSARLAEETEFDPAQDADLEMA